MVWIPTQAFSGGFHYMITGSYVIKIVTYSIAI